MDILALADISCVEVIEITEGHKEYNTGTTVNLDDGIYIRVKPILTNYSCYLDVDEEERCNRYREWLRNELMIKLYNVDKNTSPMMIKLKLQLLNRRYKKGSVIRLSEPYRVTISRIRHYKQGVSGNYGYKTRKSASTKLINDIRYIITGSRRVKNI